MKLKNLIEGRINKDYKQLERIALSVYKRINSTLHKRFNDGQATCTIATFELAKELEKENFQFDVVSGDFKDSGHWWVEVKTDKGVVIVDIGNNITQQAIKTGVIRPFIGSTRTNMDYDSEDRMSLSKFKPYYSKIKDM